MFFYSADRDEPPHIHVERERFIAKICLDPVRYESGFGDPEIRRIEKMVEVQAESLLKAWHEYFGV